jgi:hypothetical protein
MLGGLAAATLAAEAACDKISSAPGIKNLKLLFMHNYCINLSSTA